MKRAPLIAVAVLLFLLFGSSIFLFAQTSDPNQPEPTPTPDLPPAQLSIDWANIVLPEHPEFSADYQHFAEPPPQVDPPNQPSQAIVPSTQLTTYIVAPGDTIYRIARQFGISVQEIIRVNQISNPNLIHTGLILRIPTANSNPNPTAPNPPVEAPSGNGRSYTIQAGDSLYQIARNFGITIDALIQANQISNPTLIHPGTILLIPDGSGNSAPVAPPPSAPEPVSPEPTPQPPTEGSTYLVKAGDSLNSIANRFGISVEALAYANNISNWALIYPGQVLTIPAGDVVVPPPTNLPPSASGFIWPVNSRAIVQGYHGGHQAIDIVLPSGSAVLATMSGTVEFAGWNNHGYGNLIVLNHGNGIRTLYAHNSSLHVSYGQTINQGETIALSGNTGRSSMPHLHLEIMFDTFKLVNPCEHLPGGC